MAITINGTGSISGLSATGISSQPVFPGNILQVVQAFKTDTFSTTSNSFTDITGLSASITPSTASNKILIYYFVTGSAGNGYAAAFRIVRDSTAIAIADAAGSRLRSTSKFHVPSADHSYSAPGMYLDAPATTSPTTYKIQTAVQNTGTLVLNRTSTNTDSSDAYHARSTSGLILLEVAA